MALKKKRRKDRMYKPKWAEEILEEQIESALRQHDRSNPQLFLSAVNAGLEIGFSLFLMATLYSMFATSVQPAVMHMILSFAYPIGFIFVIIGRSELFTEHTTLAILPVLNRNASIRSLLILWALVYFGNLLGGYVFGYILSILPVRLGIIDPASFGALAEELIHHPWLVIAGSGILAGWLMGLLSWLVASAQETISRLLIVLLVTTLIGIGGLHHSIVGSIEVFTGVLTSPDITMSDYARVQIWATIGNLIGGVVFVAFIKFSHVNSPRRSK